MITVTHNYPQLPLLISSSAHILSGLPIDTDEYHADAVSTPRTAIMAEALQSSIPPGVKRKRPRAARACEACRAKKYRCDELYPCGKCKKQNVTCVYEVADAVRQRLFPSGDLSGAAAVAQYQPEDASSPLPTPRSPLIAAAITSNRDASKGDTPPLRNHEDDVQVDEVNDVNPHTQNPEFHGKTSSMAFLASLQPQGPKGHTRLNSTFPSTASHPSVVSLLHNEGFSPDNLTQAQQPETKLLEHERYYFRQAHAFLDGYFQNLHFIHPILDRTSFMSRCEDLWFGRAERQPRSFIALYYSLLSLGALIRTWDEEDISGMGRLEWSRRLFNLARIALESGKNETSVESVQCLFFMAKVSQNELNPSLAYLYLGWATRACFSAGFNRKRPPAAREILPEDSTIARLFWGLYSLEIETSFALGRPDGLGSDAYHNQPMPSLEGGETAIITVMVHFSRIVKEVSESIYLSDLHWEDKTQSANEIEMKMHSWLQNLPEAVRPSISGSFSLPRIAKDPIWAKRQRLVLELRFYNVKMVLFRPFLAAALRTKDALSPQIEQALEKCVAAARSTIELMHDMYRSHTFFRTWWYNTTYVLYAASIVLCYGTRVASKDDTEQYLELGRRTVEILETMEESVVAKNSAEMVRQVIASAKNVSENERNQLRNDESLDALPTELGIPGADSIFDDTLASFLDLGSDFDFLNMPFPMNAGPIPQWDDFEVAHD